MVFLNEFLHRPRFCSRPFTLNSGHESIHLCNNAVQARYTNAERSSKLPVDNMWDNKTFAQYLKEQGHGDKYNSMIYPTMKRCLIGESLELDTYYAKLARVSLLKQTRAPTDKLAFWLGGIDQLTEKKVPSSSPGKVKESRFTNDVDSFNHSWSWYVKQMDGNSN